MNKHVEKVIRKLEIETAMAVIVAVVVVGGIGGIANQIGTKAADPVSEFSQTVSAGTLAAFVRNASRVVVGSPTVAFSGTTFSFDCLTGADRTTGTLGADSQRVYVDNPDAADGGWNLTMTTTSTNTWTDGGTNKYDFNDPTASGCTDSADAGDTVGGQMTVTASAGDIIEDYSGSSEANISLQGAAAFEEGVTDTVTLVAATADSVDIWRGYFTGIDIKNTIPAEQVPAAYTLSFTITATAI